MVYLADRATPGRFELLQRMRAAVLAEPRRDEALYREANPADGGDAHTLDRGAPGWRLGGRAHRRPGGHPQARRRVLRPVDVNPLPPGNHGGP